MAYQIEEIVDAVPKGRSRGPKVDKYAELKSLLNDIPEGKVAKIAVPKDAYRRFSAGIRAAAVWMERVAASLFKQGRAWVTWVPLTAANRPKRRGGRRK